MKLNHPCLIGCIVFGLAGGAVWGAVTAEQERDLRRAESLLGEGRYGDAAELLEELVEARPGLGEAHRLLGHAYAELGRRDEARAALVEALGRGGLAADALGRLAEVDRAAGRGASLLNTLRLLMVIEPESRAWRGVYAEALEIAGAEGEAAAVWRELAERDPPDAEAWARLGGAHLRAGRAAEAAAALETAHHLGAAPAPLAEMIAALAAERGDDRRAARWYERAAADAAPEETPRLHLRRAERLFAAGDHREAQAAAERVAYGSGDAEHPRAPVAEAHRLLGRIAHERGRAREAAEHWERALEAGLGDDARLLALLGAHHYNAGRYARAADYLARHVDLEPAAPDRDLLGRLIASLLRADRPDATRPHLRRYLEHHGLDSRARAWIAVLAD